MLLASYSAGYESRQVIDLDIQRVVTEWRAEVLMDDQGNRHVAPFPERVTRPVQYGIGVKVHSVYMSQYQLIPYNRVVDHFAEQLGIGLANGSIGNFNREAYDLLEDFEGWVKRQLAQSPLVHPDETGINISGKRGWLHTAASEKYTCYYPHAKRGSEAMDEMGILPGYTGIMCHGHWKPYYKYTKATHALCNAHYLRELERAWVHQKISGCFRSWEGARIFCRIRGYLSTCRKHGVSASEALRLLFEGKLPEFVTKSP